VKRKTSKLQKPAPHVTPSVSKYLSLFCNFEHSSYSKKSIATVILKRREYLKRKINVVYRSIACIVICINIYVGISSCTKFTLTFTLSWSTMRYIKHNMCVDHGQIKTLGQPEVFNHPLQRIILLPLFHMPNYRSFS
jgi:hypothetical protein